MIFIRKVNFALFLVAVLLLVLAAPTSDPSTGELLARAQGGADALQSFQLSNQTPPHLEIFMLKYRRRNGT